MIVAWLSLTRLPAVGAQGARDCETNALLEIRSVIVDGAPGSPRPAEKLRLSSHPRTVTNRPGTNNSNVPGSGIRAVCVVVVAPWSKSFSTATMPP